LTRKENIAEEDLRTLHNVCAETSEWQFSISDPFGGKFVFQYDPAPALHKVAEQFEAHPQRSEDAINAYAKKNGLSFDEAKSKLVGKYLFYAMEYLYRQLRPTLALTLASITDRAFEATIHDLHDELGKLALIQPAISRTKAINIINEFYDRQFKTLIGETGPGSFSQWTAPELNFAIREAMTLIPDRRNRTYDNIAAILKNKFDDKAPDSGDSLRKLVKRLNINWMDLKNGKYSPSPLSAYLIDE